MSVIAINTLMMTGISSLRVAGQDEEQGERGEGEAEVGERERDSERECVRLREGEREYHLTIQSFCTLSSHSGSKITPLTLSELRDFRDLNWGVSS